MAAQPWGIFVRLICRPSSTAPLIQIFVDWDTGLKSSQQLCQNCSLNAYKIITTQNKLIKHTRQKWTNFHNPEQYLYTNKNLEKCRYNKCLHQQFCKYIIIILVKNSLMRKQIKIKLQIQNNENSPTRIIKAQFNHQYFLNYVDRKKIKYPPIIANNFNIQYMPKQIKFIPLQPRIQNQEEVFEELRRCLGCFYVLHYRAEDIQSTEEDIKEGIKRYKSKEIYGFKKFHIEEGRYEKDDVIFYAKEEINELIEELKYCMKDQLVLFDVDSLLGNKNIPVKYHNLVTKVIVSQNLLNVVKNAEPLSLYPRNIEAGSQQNGFQARQRPASSISMIITGNRLNIHKFYLLLEQKLAQIQMLVVQLQEQFTLDEKSQSFVQVFTQFNNKMFKISSNAVLILSKVTNIQQIEQIKRKLKLQIWNVNQQRQEFSKQQIRILDTQFKNRSLKMYMNHKKIFWQEILFTKNNIKITCDKATKVRFVEECKNMLKSFVKEQELCPNFDTNFLVEVFRKYYQKNLEEKFSVSFEFGENHIIRTNYSKYSEQIQEELKQVFQKIRKRVIKFLRLQSMRNIDNINLKFFSETKNPPGYHHSLLGCNLYKLLNTRIKMKRLQSLKKQQQSIVYLIDDRLQDNSIFYEVIKKNKINYQNFLLDVHKAKKPDRLRQYLTEDCPYGHKTIVLHAGRQKVTNTLKRDLQTLLSLNQNRICIILFEHNGQFLRDVFKTALQCIKIHSETLDKNLIMHSMSELNTKPTFQVQFYYEGGQSALRRIEQIMKTCNLGISRLSAFCLEELDIEKIYSLKYCSLRINCEDRKIPLSPIIAELLHYELYRSETKKQNKRKFLFSFHQKLSHQLVEYVISNKSALYYKITHDEGRYGWSSRPRIEVLEQLDQELLEIVNTVNKYFDINFMVVSAECITDGVHGRQIKYCNKFYMAKQDEDEFSGINIDVASHKIFSLATKLRYQIKINQLKQWYEVTSYKDQLDSIDDQLQI